MTHQFMHEVGLVMCNHHRDVAHFAVKGAMLAIGAID
jgi:hypothetical protein